MTPEEWQRTQDEAVAALARRRAEAIKENADRVFAERLRQQAENEAKKK